MIMPNLGDTITAEYLPAEIKMTLNQEINKIALEGIAPALSMEGIDFKTFTKKINVEVKDKIITKALELSKGNKTKAAKLLGISRFKLIREQKRKD